MPPDDTDEARLWDMLEACRELAAISEGETEQSLHSNLRYRRAVERVIFIIGEAANAVSAECRMRYPHVPWREIIGQRHFLAHEYDEIILENLWSVVSLHAPRLVTDLERILRR